MIIRIQGCEIDSLDFTYVSDGSWNCRLCYYIGTPVVRVGVTGYGKTPAKALNDTLDTVAVELKEPVR